MQIISDQKERDHVLDPRQSFIVQAPAGSGKTELLTQRYLTLLSTVEQPEEIIALTFTKKAAAEMRARIVLALNQAKQPLESDSKHAKKTWTLAKAALQQDKKQGWDLCQYSARLKIQTLDAFAGSLAKSRPLLSEGNANLTITNHPEQLYEKAAQRLIAYSYDPENPYRQSLEKIIQHLDVNFFKLERLFIEILSQREQWLPYVLDSQLMLNLNHALNTISEQTLSRLKALDPVLLDEWLSIANEAYHNLNNPLFSQQKTITYDQNALEIWQKCIELFLKKDGNFRKILTKKQGFIPASSLKDLKKKSQYDNHKKRALKLIETFQTKRDLSILLNEIISLPQKSNLDQIQSITEAIAEILPILMIELHEVFKAERAIDFNEMTLLALTALGHEEYISDLQLKIDLQIKHILVDEFQDTSISQYQLLAKLCTGWQLDEARTLFLVGDPMQSIYRFRQAEVGLFIHVQKNGFSDLNIESIHLNSNFRSSQSIVNWLNKTFYHIFPKEAIAHLGAVPYNSCNATQKVASCVEISLFESDHQEIDYILERIKASIKKNDSTAVLVRSRNHLQDLLFALKKEKIAYQAAELDYLIDDPLCSDLFTLTQALCRTDDKLAWLALLRSPFCGVNLKTLYHIAKEDSIDFYQTLLQSYESLPIEKAEKQRLQAFLKIMVPAIGSLKTKPLAEIIQSLFFSCFTDIKNIHSEYGLEILEQFLNLIETQDDPYFIHDLNVFEAILQKTRIKAKPDPNCLLHIMTIHKAKGLEFDSVILAFLNKSSANNHAQIIEWSEFSSDTGEGLFLLAPIKNHFSDKESMYDYLTMQKKMKADYELQRLFYVACSRAKQHLFLSATIELDEEENVIKPSRSTLLHLIWPQLDLTSILKRDPASVPTDRIDEKDHDYQRIPLEYYQQIADKTEPRPSLQYDFVLPSNDWQTQIGSLIHDLFSEILLYDSATRLEYQNTIKHRTFNDYLIAQLRQTNLSNHEKGLEIILHAISNLLDGKIGRWLCEQTESRYTEYEINLIEEGFIKKKFIDLTFYEAPYTWIIDHKIIFSDVINQEKIKERYDDQMRMYAKLLSKIQTHPIRLALYLPLQDELLVYD